MQLSLTQRKIAGLIRMIPEHLQNPPLSSFKKGGISCTQFIILRRSHGVTPLLKSFEKRGQGRFGQGCSQALMFDLSRQR
jgi:hypothetical protein